MHPPFTCASCKREFPLTMKVDGHAYPATETFNKWYTDYTAYAVNRHAIVLPICKSCVKKEARPVLILFFSLIALGILIMVLGVVFGWGKWGWWLGLISIGLALLIATSEWPSKDACADTIAVRVIFNSLSRRDQKNEKARLFTRRTRAKLR